MSKNQKPELHQKLYIVPVTLLISATDEADARSVLEDIREAIEIEGIELRGNDISEIEGVKLEELK